MTEVESAGGAVVPSASAAPTPSVGFGGLPGSSGVGGGAATEADPSVPGTGALSLGGGDTEGLPITQDALELRLQPAPTFTATSCPHCDNVFEVAIDFEEIKDHVEFERLKKKELEAQKEAYKQEITRFQEEVNSLKETLSNLCNQLAQAQVENLRSKQASLEQDTYIKQLKDHLKQSEEELHHLAHDFELALERNKELQATHLRNTGQLPQQKYLSSTARKISGGESVAPQLDLQHPVVSQAPSTPSPAKPGPLVTQLAPVYGGLPAVPRAAPPVPSQDKYRQQLVQFYSVHNPAKVHEVDNILREFAGHEEEMLVMLARKYCAPPIVPSRPGAGDGYGAQVPSAGLSAAPEEDDQLRRVAPWTLQMAQSRRVAQQGHGLFD